MFLGYKGNKKSGNGANVFNKCPVSFSEMTGFYKPNAFFVLSAALLMSLAENTLFFIKFDVSFAIINFFRTFAPQL